MTVLLLLATMFIQSFTRVLIIGDYYLNTGSYAALCENKAKVEMHCNGKCQMNKKLKKEDDRDKQNPERRVQNQNEFFVSDRPGVSINAPAIVTLRKSYPVLAGKGTVDQPHSIFRPPSA